MASHFMNVKNELGRIIQERIFVPRRSRHPKSPRMFYLVKRAGKIVCVWCGNFKGSDSLLLCLSNPHEGYTDQQWDAMATILQRYFKAE